MVYTVVVSILIGAWIVGILAEILVPTFTGTMHSPFPWSKTIEARRISGTWFMTDAKGGILEIDLGPDFDTDDDPMTAADFDNACGY